MTGLLDILWEDPHGLAVNKPAGLLVHPGASPDPEPTLEQRVRQHLRPDDPGSVYLGTVHRLDRPVSGVILWAKTPRAAQRWAEQFRSRTARKEYWAVVESHGPAPFAPGTVWEDWLEDPDRAGRVRASPTPSAGSSRAVTRVELGPLGPDRPPEPVQLLHLAPETGRTHQLRAQAASRGCPIVGDRTYGSRIAFGPGIALHARRLVVVHPSTRAAMTLVAEPPPSWSRWGLAAR